MPHLFLCAGEASGDLHAAALIEAVRNARSDTRFTFLGGDAMASAAATYPLIHYRRMAYMGFSEVLRHLGDIRHNLATARQALLKARPDALVLVDYPGFNLKLAETAHAAGIPIYYFIPPKVWAWKEYRVKTMRRLGIKILSILPFEPEFYARHGMEAIYVGNPSVEETEAQRRAMPSRQDFIAAHNLTSRPIMALVPGSRVGEIRNNLPVMATVARTHRDLQAVVAGAPGIDPALYRRYTTLPVVTNATFPLMAHATAALVTSGTATLECALTGTPQVVCYRANGSRLSYELFKHILKVKYVSLPNLIMNHAIIPEQLLHQCNPNDVDAALRNILPGAPGRRAQIDGYEAMRHRLGSQSAAENAAAIILENI